MTYTLFIPKYIRSRVENRVISWKVELESYVVVLISCECRNIYYSKKDLHQQIFTKIYKYHFLISISNLNFKFDTALEDSIQYLTTINLFGNIMWKSVKLHFSVSTNI